MKILQNTEMANAVWQNLTKEAQNDLNKYFHLRPTNSGVTIVSTLPFAPMRGFIATSRVALEAKLNEIFFNIEKLYSQDEGIVKETMKELGFKNRQGDSNALLEEKWQARIINNMSGDKLLKEKLNAKDNIRFIASEFIFEQGKHKVDIVGFDGNDLLFLELKKGRTTKVDQVTKYVDYYSSKEKSDILNIILKLYPCNPVKSFNTIRGVMIMEFHPNSPHNWQKLAKDNSIDILFFDKDCNWH